MAGDRALFAAFQKVRGDLEGALEQTRKKEEAARAREEAERLRMRREGFSKQAAAKGASALVRGPAMQETGKKSAAAAKSAAQVQPQPAAAEPRRLSKAAAAGAFGSLLADAANSAGAVFRSAEALKSEADRGGRKEVRDRAQANAAGEKPRSSGAAKAASPTTASHPQKRADDAAPARRARKPRPADPAALERLASLEGFHGGRARSGKGERTEKTERNGRAADRKQAERRLPGADGQPAGERALRASRGERAPRLSWAERRNPIAPFELAPGLPVSERADEIIRAIQENQVGKLLLQKMKKRAKI